MNNVRFLKNRFLVCGLVVIGLLTACGRHEQTTNATSQAADVAASQSLGVAIAEISNANNFALAQEPIYFSFYDLGLASNDSRIANLAVLNGDTPQPSQLVDSNGDSLVDGILLQANFNPAETKTFKLVSDAALHRPVLAKQTQAEISIKEGGEWKDKEYIGGTFKNVTSLTPPEQYTDHSFYIRYEGPGIESDKVGYRVYLDWRNGFDIFGKKVAEAVLQNVGQDGYDSYHKDAPWGQDLLKVGKSLGIGGFGFWNGKSAEGVAQVDKRTATITNNGDLFSGFNIRYQGWHINNSVLDLNAHLSINAGSRLAKVSLKTDKDIPNFAIGLAKLPNTELIQGNSNITGSAWTYVATWGQQSLSSDKDNLGMAIIFHKGDRKQQTEDEHSHVSVMGSNGGELEYYIVAAWDKELNGIKSRDEFVAYLNTEVERLTKTPRIRFESALSKAAKGAITSDAALQWAKKLADSELERKTLKYFKGGWDEFRKRPSKFEYDIVGMQIDALQRIHEISPNPHYPKALEVITGSYIEADGSIATFEPTLFSIDLTKPGQMVILLEQRTKEEKYRKAVDFLRKQLSLHPRTSEGAFWHRATYPNQLWLDGVYMGIPFLAQYASLYETGATQHKSFEEAVHEFVVARKHLRDSATGLYFHAWDESRQAEWADKQTGRAPQFWSRGMGWYAMALVDVLDYLPESEPELRKILIDIVNEFAADIVRYQDAETHTWWQITQRPNEIANYRESSASAMFSYFFLKAVNKHYLPASYKDIALQSYTGIINEFISVHDDGKISMNDQCLVAGLGFGRNGSYDYYQTEAIVSNDPKGNSPFIYASLEAYKLLKP